MLELFKQDKFFLGHWVPVLQMVPWHVNICKESRAVIGALGSSLEFIPEISRDFLV